MIPAMPPGPRGSGHGRPRRPTELKRRLERAGVEYVRILWCDNANVIRGKAAHVRLLAGGLPEGVGITAAQQALPVMYDAVVPESGLGPIGEVRLVPDWSTLHVCHGPRPTRR